MGLFSFFRLQCRHAPLPRSRRCQPRGTIAVSRTAIDGQLRLGVMTSQTLDARSQMAKTYSRNCKFCGESIRMSFVDGEWMPFDDGGRHWCQRDGRTPYTSSVAAATLPSVPAMTSRLLEPATAREWVSQVDDGRLSPAGRFGCFAVVIVVILFTCWLLGWL